MERVKNSYKRYRDQRQNDFVSLFATQKYLSLPQAYNRITNAWDRKAIFLYRVIHLDLIQQDIILLVVAKFFYWPFMKISTLALDNCKYCTRFSKTIFNINHLIISAFYVVFSKFLGYFLVVLIFMIFFRLYLYPLLLAK